LKREADWLLEELGLVSILEQYGIVCFTGSYQYDLMTRRDIDICVEVDSPCINDVFAMGEKIALLPGVGSMLFRNEFVLHTLGNPVAIFWCVDVESQWTGKWNVDILISTPAEVERIVIAGEELLRGLDEEKRASILEIKGPLSAIKEYGISFKSTNIYEAVMEAGVKDLAGWKEWWKNKKKSNQ